MSVPGPVIQSVPKCLGGAVEILGPRGAPEQVADRPPGSAGPGCWRGLRHTRSAWTAGLGPQPRRDDRRSGLRISGPEAVGRGEAYGRSADAAIEPRRYGAGVRGRRREEAACG
ncbi:hypothetical protein NDU88_004746 [Pleurodeles waltl]|uniref:Uncharacterized protein n=1 Tax=Pleurodeles waltl TaxID=8319 RepID=A0AAV7MAY1_PLEWA|nr:hypothetical protein NDU88_004746 [Pleurodeles waltl]